MVAAELTSNRRLSTPSIVERFLFRLSFAMTHSERYCGRERNQCQGVYINFVSFVTLHCSRSSPFGKCFFWPLKVRILVPLLEVLPLLERVHIHLSELLLNILGILYSTIASIQNKDSLNQSGARTTRGHLQWAKQSRQCED